MKLPLLLFTIVATVQTNTYFRRVGWITPNPSYGHVHLTIDLMTTHKHIESLNSVLQTLHDQIHTIPHQIVRIRARTFIHNALKETQNLQSMYNEYLNLLSATPQDEQRVKRFLGMLMAMTSLTMSLFNTGEIFLLQASMSDVISRQHHITDILQEHEISIQQIKHDVGTIRDGFIKTINVVEENSAMSQIHDAELQISMAIAEMHRIVNCLQMGTERLFTHRLPSCFLNATNIIQAHKRLMTSAAKKNLTPISLNAASFLQFETSFIIKNHMLHIFIHVPLMDVSQNLELLQFFAIPISITPTLHMTIASNDRYLAIGKDGLHATISTQDLQNCLRYTDLHFCNTPLILSKQIDASCLGAIYSQNFTHLQQKCPAVFFKSSEIIESLSANEVMIYTESPQTIQVTCPKGSKHVAIQSNQLLKLEQDCTVSTRKHIFKTGFDMTVNNDIQRWPSIWNISQTLFDIEPSSLEDIIHKLQLIDSRPTPIRDLKKIIWMNNHRNVNIALSTTISIIFVVLICTISFLMYRYCKLSKSSATDHNNA